MHNCLDFSCSCSFFFFFAVKCTEISMRVMVPLWELGVGIIKLQNDLFVLFALPRGQVARKSRLLSFILEICLSGLSLAVITGYFGTVHFSSNCILQQKNVFQTLLSCLWYSIQLPCLHFWIPTGHFHVQPGIKICMKAVGVAFSCLWVCSPCGLCSSSSWSICGRNHRGDVLASSALEFFGTCPKLGLVEERKINTQHSMFPGWVLCHIADTP